MAYHWEGEPGDTRTITYAEMLDDVSRLANALNAYKSGQRKHPSMLGIAASLTDKDIADLAAYYAAGH